MAMIQLDEIDVSIIEELKKDARLSLRDLSKIINVSVPTISSRVKRLEDAGVIKGYKAIIDLGDGKPLINALIFVDVDKYKEDDFFLYLEKSANINSLSSVTGDFSYLIYASFVDLISLNTFVESIGREFGKTRVSVELKRRDFNLLP